jgi:hypothetical protein
MAQRLKVSLLVAASLGAALPARAEQPRAWTLTGRHVLVSVERAASALFWSRRRQVLGSDSRLKPQGFDISLLSQRSAVSRSSLPRFAADFVTPDGVSVGAAIGLGYTKADASATLQAGAKGGVTELVLAPRVGFVAPLSPRLALWPRVGVSRTSYSSSSVESAIVAWDVTLDPQLAVVIVPRVVFTTGALFEASFSDDNGDRSSQLAYGVTAGLAAMF